MARLYRNADRSQKSVEGGVGPVSGGVSRMDAATELTWMYLQRPPQPDPPRHSSANLLLLRLLLSLWPLRVQGAALPN